MLSCASSGRCRKGVLNEGVVTGSDGLKEGFGFSICHCQEVGIVLCFSPLLCHRDFFSLPLEMVCEQSGRCSSGCVT